jgi:hypothetical protein
VEQTPLFAEEPPNLLEVIGQEFVSEVQGESLAEIELEFVRDLKELVTVADVVGQWVETVDELGMAINFAGPFAQKRFVLVSATRGHELEGFL